MFLFDNFKEEIILAKDKDTTAPRERYFEIDYLRSDQDIYIDTYFVKDNLAIDFAYSYEESWNTNYSIWLENLYNHFEKNNLERKPYYLKRRIYPKERFKRLLKQYYSGPALDYILKEIIV